jgi:hypothetical protein
MLTCHRPSDPVAVFDVRPAISTWTASPGFDQPQMVFGFPRWRTMLSPKIGLTNGSEVLSAAGAVMADRMRRARIQIELARIGRSIEYCCEGRNRLSRVGNTADQSNSEWNLI